MREVYVLEDLLNTLMELEIKGFNFYEEYKNNSEDEGVKQLFGELASAEKNHYKYYKELKEKFINTRETPVDEEYKVYVDTLIKNSFFIMGSNFNVKNEKEALDLAERLEKDTIIFMNELERIIDDKKQFKLILEEEKRHLLKIYLYKNEHGIA